MLTDDQKRLIAEQATNATRLGWGQVNPRSLGELVAEVTERIAAPFLNGARPKIAILREQGVNSHIEMSYAMHSAGFETFDLRNQRGNELIFVLRM